jgi:hypothetical protein
MFTQTKKPTNKQFVNDSLIEQLRDIGKGVGKGITKDLINGVGQDALTSLFGQPRKSGDLKPNESINLNQPVTPQNSEYPPFPSPYNQQESPFPFPFKKPERQFVSQFTQENINKLKEQETQVAQKIEEIRMELKALIKVIRNVDIEMQQAVNEHLIDPGVYHLNFLDRIKTILKLLRQNLHDSSSWLNVMRSKKRQRTYWALYKKKGTEFGLNNERTVATQVG